MDRTAARFALWVLLGSMLLQAAWVLALPPFRGIDEFDHAYRAAAVADGQWLPVGPHRRRTAAASCSVVPAGMVEDAGPVCRALEYTGQLQLRARRDAGRRTGRSSRPRPRATTRSSTGCSGTAARPFDGAAALHAMRLTNALLCSLVLAAGAWVTARWARTVWPRVGSSPPHAGHRVRGRRRRPQRAGGGGGPRALDVPGRPAAGGRGRPRPVRGAGGRLRGARWRACAGWGRCGWPSSCCVGAAWLGPRLVVGASCGPTRRAAAGPRRRRGPSRSAGAPPGRSSAGRWTWRTAPRAGDPSTGTLAPLPLWLLQSRRRLPAARRAGAHRRLRHGAAGPGRRSLGLGLVAGRPSRPAVVVLLALVVAVAVPFALQVQAFDVAGLIWQGRYGWPFGLGVARAWPRPRSRSVRPGTRSVPAHPSRGGACGLVAHAVSVDGRAAGRAPAPAPTPATPRWLTAPAWVVAADGGARGRRLGGRRPPRPAGEPVAAAPRRRTAGDAVAASRPCAPADGLGATLVTT